MILACSHWYCNFSIRQRNVWCLYPINSFLNYDIIASVAGRKNKPFTVGFAAETQNLLEYARTKLHRKNLDLIAANEVANPQIGFNSDSNALTLISEQQQLNLAQTSKSKLAQQLIEHIAKLIAK